MTSEGSFLSRATLRFLEVFAAGLATAVSGYLIAHFASLTPVAAVKPAPAIQQGNQSAPQAAVAAQPAAAPSPAISVVKDTPAKAAPESVTAEQPPSANGPASTNGLGAKAHEAEEAKAREEAEARSREAEKAAAARSFEARMRAALAKAGPGNPAPSETPRRQTVAPIETTPRANAAAPRPVDTPTGSIAGAPQPSDSTQRSGPIEPASIAAAPAMGNAAAPPATSQLAPPATVEIKSQPVANIDADQSAQAAAQTPSKDQDGPFAAITKRLHLDNLLPGDGPPRPPMPVGQ